MAPVTDRLGLGCGGVGARSGAAGKSIGVECAVDRGARARQRSVARGADRLGCGTDRSGEAARRIIVGVGIPERRARVVALKVSRGAERGLDRGGVRGARMEIAQQVLALTDQAHTASARAHVTDGKDSY